MQLFINSPIGKTYTIDFYENETIYSIFNKIMDKETFKDYSNLILTYGGKILNKKLTVQDYNIHKESTIFATVPLLGGGIPSYVRQIIEKHSTCHFWKEIKVDNLLIDFNSIIYQVISNLTDTGLSSVEYEELLLYSIIKQLEHVICEVIKPSKIVYIAMDGVPPRAKMIQQRARRYKLLKEQSFKESLEKKYKIEIPTVQWNRSAISPGTTFMIKLSKLIVKHIKQRTFQAYSNNVSVVFSDSSVPGEGEHKLLPTLHKVGSDENTVIYSPDADLVVLSIMSNIRNIYILREPKDSVIETTLYKNNEFLYLDIDNIRIEFEKSMGI